MLKIRKQIFCEYFEKLSGIDKQQTKFSRYLLSKLFFFLFFFFFLFSFFFFLHFLLESIKQLSIMDT